MSRTYVLYLVSMATFLRTFAQVIYSASIVSMRTELQVSTALIGLTISIYGLVLALAQFGIGPLVDRFDGKQVLLGGLGVFAVASMLVYFVQGLGGLLLGRALQALGISAAAAVGIAMIADLFPDHERGRAMGVFELFNASGGASGFVVGAAVAAGFGWRADFLVLALISLVLFVLAARYVPKLHAPAQHIGLEHMAEVFRRPATFGALVLGLVHFYGMYTVITLVPVLLVDGYGLGAGPTGLVVSCLSIGAVIGALAGGRSADKSGSRPALLSGSLAALVAALLLNAITLAPAGAVPVLILALAVLAVGMGIGFSLPVQIKVMVEHFPVIRGTAGALLYFTRFTGATLAPVLVGWLSDAYGLPVSFGSMVILLALGTLVGYFTLRPPSAQEVVFRARA